MAYDDATGGVAYNDIYCDQNGNECVKLSGSYYKVEPLKWIQLTTSDGTEMLLSENELEQVPFCATEKPERLTEKQYMQITTNTAQ